jgi:hypothetical protein
VRARGNQRGIGGGGVIRHGGIESGSISWRNSGISGIERRRGEMA